MASDITSISAISGGNITNDGGAAISARGVCWSTGLIAPTVTLGTKTIDDKGTGSFSSNISGLTPVTTYNVRAYATNNIGTAYGEQQTFTTTANYSTVSTNAVSNISSNTVTYVGSVISDGGAPVTALGVCWSTDNNPTVNLSTKTVNGSGTGTFSNSINGLNPGTIYFIRAYATNSVGTMYGNEISFTTKQQLTDIEGNVYHTIAIGSQVWMIENLKTKKYSNGDPIPNVAGGTAWTNLKTGAYCDYNNNANNSAVYGRLYNWYALNDSRRITPDGWHIPTSMEWLALENFLGGQTEAGGKLKETGTTHWMTPNMGANNLTGFTALPGGFCGSQNGGIYAGIGTYAFFWSATENGVNSAWSRTLTSDSNIFYGSGGDKATGYSIRCVMNNFSSLSSGK